MKYQGTGDSTANEKRKVIVVSIWHREVVVVRGESNIGQGGGMTEASSVVDAAHDACLFRNRRSGARPDSAHAFFRNSCCDTKCQSRGSMW